MVCLEDSIEISPNTAGVLTIYYDGNNLYSQNIKPLNIEETFKDSVNFYDSFDNSYLLIISISDCILGFTVSKDSSHTRPDIQENICGGLYSDYVEEDNIEESDSLNNIVDGNFNDISINGEATFSIRFSKEKNIKELTDIYKRKKDNDVLVVENLSQLYDDVKLGSLLFMVAGGELGKITLKYEQGLYAVAKVIKEPYQRSGRNYKIKIEFIYYYPKVLSPDDFYNYIETKNISDIGALTGGRQNQAIKKLTPQNTIDIINASFDIVNESKNLMYSLFPFLSGRIYNITNKSFNNTVDTLKPGLKITKIAKVFSTYIVNHSADNTSTLIGIFGRWGRGKTFLYEEIEKRLKKNNKKNQNKFFYFCSFQPWKYQEQNSAWAYLYQQILKEYLASSSNKDDWVLMKWLKEKWKILILNKNRLGSWQLISLILLVLLSAVYIYTPFVVKYKAFAWVLGLIGTGGVILLLKTHKLYLNSYSSVKIIIDKYIKAKDYSHYLGFQNEIEYELKILLETFIDSSNKKLLLFIDDLDRCNEKMIIDIMDSLRLVLDDEKIKDKIIIITAIDERILENSIQYKYFNNGINSKIDAKEYIEKFFLIGIKLNELQDKDIDELVSLYSNQLNQLDTEEKENTQAEEKKIEENEQTEEKKIEENEQTEEKKIEEDEQAEEKKIEENEQTEEKNIEEDEQTEEDKILTKEEIQVIKETIKELQPSTPRKINIILHRYLLFKSFLLEMFQDDYKKFDSKMLIQFLVLGQDSNTLKFFKGYEVETKNSISSPMIYIPLENFQHLKIQREEYHSIIKIVDMVTPF